MPDSEIYKKLLQGAYRYLSIRDRSNKEMTDYLCLLASKLSLPETSSALVALVIDKLKEQNLLDDVNFAKKWVEFRGRKKGAILLKNELLQKGIEVDLIDAVLDNVSVDDNVKQAVELLDRKGLMNLGLNHYELKNKAYRFLLRRGFESKIIDSAIEKYLEKE